MCQLETTTKELAVEVRKALIFVVQKMLNITNEIKNDVIYHVKARSVCRNIVIMFTGEKDLPDSKREK